MSFYVDRLSTCRKPSNRSRWVSENRVVRGSEEKLKFNSLRLTCDSHLPRASDLNDSDSCNERRNGATWMLASESSQIVRIMEGGNRVIVLSERILSPITSVPSRFRAFRGLKSQDESFTKFRKHSKLLPLQHIEQRKKW